jgi:hypothetical protein
MSEGYDFPGGSLAELILRRFYPERTHHESAIIRDYLLAHGLEYDRFQFSVRVGAGNPTDPEHLVGIQKSTAWSSRKRIDAIFWQGPRATIAEVKQRINPEVLGQLQTYAALWHEENPDFPPPKLIALGRYSDQDTLRVLAAHGIDVYLYDAPAPPGPQIDFK